MVDIFAMCCSSRDKEEIDKYQDNEQDIRDTELFCSHPHLEDIQSLLNSYDEVIRKVLQNTYLTFN